MMIFVYIFAAIGFCFTILMINAYIGIKLSDNGFLDRLTDKLMSKLPQ